ncbi:MAG: VWA domain-containing protein, partial [Cytophagaceae bacterium]
MEKFQLITEYSPWFAILCILAGLGYAFLLYQKKGPWNNTLNKVLFSFRFVLITALCLLLLGPLARFIKNYIESPTVVFAIDNSQSIEYGTDSLSLAEFRKNLNILSENLKKENIKTEFYFLDNAENTSSDFKFTAASTDLSKILKDIRSDFENRNISAIIMASDGIFNQGISPVHSHHHVPIYTIGLGDTIAKKDLNLKKVFYNKIAYAGNKFPIVAEIHNTGYEGKETTIFLKQNNKILDRKTLRFSREQD